MSLAKEYNRLVFIDDDETYIFNFFDNQKDEMLCMIVRFAADPELYFSWYDAAMLLREIRMRVPTEKDEDGDDMQFSHPYVFPS